MALVREGVQQHVPLKLPKKALADLPAASAANAGTLVYVTAGGGSPDAAGQLAFSDGVNWVDVVTNTTLV